MKYFQSLLISFLLAGIFACSSSKKHSSSPVTSKDSLLAAIERNVCFGRCPEYKALIYKSELVEYYGRRNVSKVGFYTSRIDAVQLNDIYSQIRTFKLEDADTAHINPHITDIADWSVWVSDFKPRKHIFIRHQAPPENIKLFGNRLDEILDSLTWTKVSGKNDE